MLPTGEISESDEEEDYPEQNVRAIRQSLHAFQQQAVQAETEPKPIMVRAGQDITRTHQCLVDLAIDSMEYDEHVGLPNLVIDDEDQESIDGMPNFEVQDDGIIECMHDIAIMAFPDDVIRVNKQTGQIVLLHNIVRGPIEPTVPQLESWAVSDNGASEAFNLCEANDIWVRHGLDRELILAHG